MNITQAVLHSVEEGKARILTRLIPFAMVLLVVTALYDTRVFSGLHDSQSMDNAQVARQISRGEGFTTQFIRPYALSQLNSRLPVGTSKSAGLFPASRFGKGKQRVLPDTYNAPAYPYLLAGWFDIVRPNFQQSAQDIASIRLFPPDRRVIWMNQILMAMTAGLIFFLGLRLFDQRVAWLAMTSFFLTNAVWQFSITGLSTTCLMLLTTVILIAAVEVFVVGEAAFMNPEATTRMAWPWVLILAVVTGLACLVRLDLVVLLLPLGLYLGAIPQVNKLIIPFLILIVAAITGPWFWHMYQLSGSPIGSNLPLLHYGTPGYEGNQVYCTLGTPNYNQLFKDLVGKAVQGFIWHFGHAWEMLGSNPLALFFFLSVLHDFKQGSARTMRWLIIGAAVCLVVATSLGSPNPGAQESWNSLIILLPGMLVMGSAFFFVLLDRLHLDLWIINNAIVVGLLAIISLPMVGALVNAGSTPAYPPYSPAALRFMGDYVKKEEWVTTDMPWAEAWYGDHASVWLPDNLNDFYDVYDNYNSSGLLLITPELLSQPAQTFTTGEYKDWMPFISSAALPANFPLDARSPTAAAVAEYYIWTRRGN